MHRSIHIQRAGLYAEFVSPPEEVAAGLHLLEFFDAAPALGDADIARCFSLRAERCREAALVMVLRRIGLLGSDPAHLALWTFPSYRQMEPFLAEQSMAQPIELRTCGVYRALGKEIL